VTFNTVRVLQRVFMHLAAKEVLDLGASEDKKEANKQHPLKAAALGHYKAFVRTLIALLLHRHDQVKVRTTIPPLLPSFCMSRGNPVADSRVRRFVASARADFGAQGADGVPAQEDHRFQRGQQRELVPAQALCRGHRFAIPRLSPSGWLLVSPTHHLFLPCMAFSERLVSESNGKETGLFSQFVGKYLSKYDDIRYYTLKSLRYSTHHHHHYHHVTFRLLPASMFTAVSIPASCVSRRSRPPSSRRPTTRSWRCTSCCRR
jgi:hypothetical protein